MIGSKPVSNNFLVFIDLSQGGTDTLVSIITNGDVASGLSQTVPTFDFTYVLTNQPEQGAVKIIHNYYSKITSNNNSLLQEINIFNNVATDPNLEREIIDYVYPQPFSYKLNTTLNIPVELNPANEAELYIYTPAMDLVYYGKHQIFSVSKIIVQWDGKDNNGMKLSSGIYIYITKSGDNIKKGKFVIYND